MTLVRLDNISIEFGTTPLLLNTDFSVEQGEKICLIGRNGAGKSTLLSIINGTITPDHGERHYRQHLRISQLQQNLPGDLQRVVADVVREGLALQHGLIEQYNALAASELDDHGLRQLHDLQTEIDAAGGWQVDQWVETMVSQLDLPASSTLADLSGGWQRRVALGKALVSKPDLLLLDEPTNHLDISTIEWLEHVIKGYAGAVLFITHDRNFLQRLATRIVEIDRGRLLSWPGNYQNYLVQKEKANEEEDTRNALFDKRLAQEESWIREGIKARRTRNEGRVRALKAMRKEREQRIARQGKATIHVDSAEQSGRKVIEARNVTHGYGGNTLLEDFSLKVLRGDRIGLVGNNGVGKTTLLKILLGLLIPDKGSVKLGTNLDIAYFDQLRRDLQPDRTVAENVADGKEHIKINGRDRHIIGYLQQFLFSPKRAMTPVRALSGGECNRVLLAKMFTRSANLLVLDEPTNDLDVEMLEVLEERLVQYDGTLLIVSHDRDFLDNVITSTVVFEEDRKVLVYPGGYSDWARRGAKLLVAESPVAQTSEQAEKAAATPKAKPRSQRLTYKLQLELDQLPTKMEALEKEVELLQQRVSQPEFYTAPFAETQPVLDQLTAAQQALEDATSRWVELDDEKTSG
ncbi:MAG: ATP-binding cassette domain-containing protein [Pseudomonadales bacterium]